MIRSTFVVLLASFLVLQPTVATAQDASLRKRLGDIPGEVDRFLADLPDSDRGGWSQPDDEDVATSRLRVRIQNLPAGQDIAVTVRGGEHFEGELAEADGEAFRALDTGRVTVRQSQETTAL